MKAHIAEVPGVWPAPGAIAENLPVAYTEVDTSGVFRVANAAACRQYGVPADQLVGHEIWEFLAADEAARSRVAFLELLESGEEPPIIRRSLYSAGGEFRTHELHRRWLRDSAGNRLGIACVAYDVSHIENADREARTAKLWLESVVEAIPQALMVTDALGFVRYVNPAAERVTGWSAHEMVGLQIEKRMPILRAASPSQRPLSFRIALEETWNGDVEILNRQRQTISTWLSACPIIDRESGFTNGVVIVFRSVRTNALAPGV